MNARIGAFDTGIADLGRLKEAARTTSPTSPTTVTRAMARAILRILTEQARAKITPGMIKCYIVNKSKIAITVSPLVLTRLDAWVKSEHFASRSEAIEQAVEAQLQRLERTRLSEQCALLDVAEEQAMADIGLATDAATWPVF